MLPSKSAQVHEKSPSSSAAPKVKKPKEIGLRLAPGAIPATFPPAQMPTNEAARLAVLKQYAILDTGPERAFDELCELSAHLSGCAMAYVSIIDASRQWLKSAYGFEAEALNCPRELSFCADTIMGGDLLIVPDLAAHPRYRNYPLVVGEPYLRFYCGAPLVTAEGFALGTLCVIDTVPHQLDKAQEEWLRRVARQALIALGLRHKIFALDAEILNVRAAEVALQAEKEKSDTLLHHILPHRIVKRIGDGETLIADRIRDTTILFADIVGFTSLSSTLAPEETLELLDLLFSRFDAIAVRLGLEKIKTIGDGYMVAGGVPDPHPGHAAAVAEMALAMHGAAKTATQALGFLGRPLQLRIGIHSGPVVAGVIGRHKFAYDIWGDAVNTASRMEKHGAPGRVHVSTATRAILGDAFHFEPCGSIAIKGKGEMETFFLERKHISSDL
jgi:adenylate cyclase